MKFSKAFLWLAVSPLALFATAASAQDDSVAGSLNTQAADLFARDRNVSVRARPHPEYEAAGMRAGGFLIYPRADLSVESNDNIYAVDTNTTSDTIYRFAPRLSIVSDWNRHSLQAYARGTVTRYGSHNQEDADEYEIGTDGRLDIQRMWQATGHASYARISEPREAENTPYTSAKPIQYYLSQVNAGTQRTFNRIRLSGNVDWSRYNYKDGYTLGSATVPSVVIDQDVRDRDVTAVTARGDYAISPDTAVFLQVTGNKRFYDIGSTALYAARDSKGVEVLAGADFQVTNLITGNMAVGYISQNYDDVRFKDIKSLGGRMTLEWYPTQLTTVTGTIERTVEDSVVIGAGGFLATNYSAQIDHELLRNVILTGQLAYGEDDFRGVDRMDKRTLGSVSGTYLLNRYIGIGLTLSYLDQSSSGLDRGREFTVRQAMLSLVLQR